MPTFDLRESPFYVLGVSPRDDSTTIEEAKEAAISDGRLSEPDALRLQQTLMASRRRLGAELSWLLGVAPNRARRLVDETSLAADEAAGLPLLAAANVAAHRCAQKLLPAHPDLLIRFYRQDQEEQTLGILNPERRASGFPEVSPELLREALQELTHAHVKALVDFIISQPTPGFMLLGLIKDHFAEESTVVPFLDEVVDKFDTWAADSLQGLENTIFAALDSIRKDPANSDEQLRLFALAIRKWSMVEAPRQFMMGRRHLQDPRTERLLSKIRGVCLHLHNDLGDPQTPLAITKAALPAFEGSPDHLRQLRADILTLEELAASHVALKVVEPLVTLVSEVNSDHRALCRSIKRGNFKASGSGLAGDLYRAFDRAQRDLAGDPARAAAFRIILSLAIDLNNQSQATEEALLLIRALQAISDVPADVADALSDNGRVAHQTLLQKQLSAAIQAQRFGRSATLAKKLEEAATDQEDRASWSRLRREIEHRRKVQIAKWIGWPLVVGGIIAFASLSDNKSTSSSHRPSNYSVPTARPADVLTASQVQWCVFELDRLKRIRAMTGETAPPAVADAWNARNADWNARCSAKKYYQSDYDAAQQKLEASFARQQSDALALYRSWSSSSLRLVPGMNR
jgi:hypothetical protein